MFHVVPVVRREIQQISVRMTETAHIRTWGML